MRKLIDNMLFLAQGDAGQTPAIQIPVHFSELAWSVLLQFEPIAYEKQIELVRYSAGALYQRRYHCH